MEAPGVIEAPYTETNRTLEKTLTIVSLLTLVIGVAWVSRPAKADDSLVSNGMPAGMMPWPVYSNMSPRQIRAIYEYLSAIPPVKVRGLP